MYELGFIMVIFSFVKFGCFFSLNRGLCNRSVFILVSKFFLLEENSAL